MTLADRFELREAIAVARAVWREVERLAETTLDDRLDADINTARTFIAAAGDRADWLILNGDGDQSELDGATA